ncbi:GNAT family N-acetyltransferase [Alteribacillus sp. HJP-4]|uniref:GNAT family N-acetyltransferase n=1 Tax=Alteribacillus sp. HJP-4 TaxID=2775394 RepID=UPI0035CD2881
MNKHKVTIQPYHAKYAEQMVSMWRVSKELAIGQKEIHSFADHDYFLKEILNKQYKVELALIDEKIVGMIAFNESEINQLYIHLDYQGIGIGQTLLKKAKVQSSGSLSLYTFEINKKAQRFYEKNGFKIIDRGHKNEENLPDLLYEWTSE